VSCGQICFWEKVASELQIIMLFEPCIGSNLDNYKLENNYFVAPSSANTGILSDTITHVKVES